MAQSEPTRPATATVKVWDIFVRFFHWTTAAAFFVAYLTEDDLLTLHVWAGYTVGVLVVLRVLWGFVGPQHARFSDFFFGPAKAWRYLIDLVAFRAKRYLGHSPAGAAMVFALLVGLAATVWTGLELYAVEENAGPLATRQTQAAPPAARSPLLVFVNGDGDRADDEDEDGRPGDRRDGGIWEDLHEALAEVTLLLVILHIGGVVLASVVHRENLAKSMITGRKRAE